VGAAAALVFLGEDEPGGPSDDQVRQSPARLSVVGGDKGSKDAATEPVVLLVEDDMSMQLLCKFNLEAAGFRVTTAATGGEGVELAKAERFDLILLDVMLPDLGGFEVAQDLRASEVSRDVPIVFVSARASGADLAQGRAAGAIDYVTKPFDPVKLAERLREDLAELARSGADAVWEWRLGPAER
jgi:two-component system, OmpR family, phosphate regulon response regulator PhoB